MTSFLRPPAWKSLSRGAVTTFGLRVLGAGLLYGLHVALARWASADGYGAYVFAISWTSVLAQLGALGLPSAALRFVPEYRTSQRLGLLRGFLRTGRGVLLAGTSGLALAAIGIALVVPTGSIHLPALLTGLALTPLMGLLLFEKEVLRACNRFAWAYAPDQILRPLLVGGTVGALVWATGTVSPVQMLLCMGGAFVLLIPLQQWGTRATLREAYEQTAERRPRRWLRVALPLLLTGGFQLVLNKTDIFVVGTLVGAEEVGIYFAALRTAQAITFLSFAVDAVAGPEVARLYHGESDDLQRTVSGLAHWYFWPTLAAALGLLLVAEPVLSLFGPAFTAGQPMMAVLMVGFLINAATGAQTHLLTLTGHERSCAYIYGWCAALNIGLNLAGVYAYGALGAAFATATTLTVRNLWVRRRVVHLTGLRPSIVAALWPASPSHA
jgi:O-antigen/teichoic acid export membrane protein